MLMHQVYSVSFAKVFFSSRYFFPSSYFFLSHHSYDFLLFAFGRKVCVLVNGLFLWLAAVLVPVASFGWDAFPRGS